MHLRTRAGRFLFIVVPIIILIMLLNCSESIPELDSQKAYDYILTQCAFGARVPNSKAHSECEDYLYDKLSEYADIVNRQEFTYYDEERNDTLYLTNLIASFNPEASNRILLCSHWDCRPWADKEADSSLHNQPVMGANDGASGVALLLTIAEIIKNNPLDEGIDIIFFDGEDYGKYAEADQWLLGSKYFTENIGNYRPRYVLLVDMIADKDLDIHRDSYSNTYAGWLSNRVLKAAELEQAENFYTDVLHTVYDDHVPFLLMGIPAVVIIDMDYEWWHTINDIPENCSVESLDEVGRVVLRMLYDKELNN